MSATPTTTTFREWRRQRPFVGALLLLLAGVEMFFSTQLDIGNMHIQLGVEGFQATIIPIGFVLLAVLIAVMPQHRIFYGVIALALSIYSIVGVNLGGFVIGMLLSAVGGVLAVSWAPQAQPASGVGTGTGAADEDAAAPGSAALESAEPAVEPAPADRELVGAMASGHDGAVHAEFVPYPALVARARAASDHTLSDTPAGPPPFSRAPLTGPGGAAPRKAAPSSGSGPGAAAAALLLFVGALTGVGVAEAPEVQAAVLAGPAPVGAPAAEPAALCVPLLMTCPPSPSPSPSQSSGGGLIGGLLGGVKVPGASGSAPLVIGPDDSAYRMTLPAGQLGGSSISIKGIHQVGLVTVKKVDGSSFAVIKMTADDVVITGFLLDVRRATGPSLVSSADRMELKGNVSVWLDSLTGTTLGGVGLTLGTDQTPPPGSELPPKLLRVNLGLVATSANSINYVNLHQELHG